MVEIRQPMEARAKEEAAETMLNMVIEAVNQAMMKFQFNFDSLIDRVDNLTNQFHTFSSNPWCERNTNLEGSYVIIDMEDTSIDEYNSSAKEENLEESYEESNISTKEDIPEYFIGKDIPDVDLSTTIVVSSFSEPEGQLDIYDSAIDCLKLMKSIFDFQTIQPLIASTKFTFCYDDLNEIDRVYAKRIIVEDLGAIESSLLNCVLRGDPGGGHSDPNLTYVKELIARMSLDKLVTVEDIMLDHLAKFGQHYYNRYNYKNVDAGAARELMTSLVKLQSLIEKVKGVSSEGATIRLYNEKYEKDASMTGIDLQDAQVSEDEFMFRRLVHLEYEVLKNLNIIQEGFIYKPPRRPPEIAVEKCSTRTSNFEGWSNVMGNNRSNGKELYTWMVMMKFN